MLLGCEHYLPEKLQFLKDNKQIAVIVVQHLLDDTYCFLKILKSLNVNIVKVIGINYSHRLNAVEKIKSLFSNTEIVNYQRISKSISITIEQLKKQKEVDRLMMLDVGGYLGLAIKEIEGLLDGIEMSVIEETLQGMLVYNSIPAIPAPVVDIPSSKIKKIESIFVGQSLANNLNQLLPELFAYSNFTIGIIGTGSVGSALAVSLKQIGCQINCYDINPIINIESIGKKFGFPNKEKVFNSDLIICCTGKRSIENDDLRQLPDGVYLANGSSKQVEFDVGYIEEHSHSKTVINKSICNYVMHWGKSLVLINDGYPINFTGESLPIYIADLLFMIISAGMHLAYFGKLENGTHIIPLEYEMELADVWLRRWGQKLIDHA